MYVPVLRRSSVKRSIIYIKKHRLVFPLIINIIFVVIRKVYTLFSPITFDAGLDKPINRFWVPSSEVQHGMKGLLRSLKRTVLSLKDIGALNHFPCLFFVECARTWVCPPSITHIHIFLLTKPISINTTIVTCH